MIITELLTSTIEPLVVPEPLLAEVGYMLGTHFGVVKPRHVDAFTLLP